jgi:hypothetical protein
MFIVFPERNGLQRQSPVPSRASVADAQALGSRVHSDFPYFH